MYSYSIDNFGKIDKGMDVLLWLRFDVKWVISLFY